jgi:hypothetical protein
MVRCHYCGQPTGNTAIPVRSGQRSVGVAHIGCCNAHSATLRHRYFNPETALAWGMIVTTLALLLERFITNWR